MHGSRVALGDGRVVLPWREELRYGPRKAGYHGGAAPAEVVIPLIVLSAAGRTPYPAGAGAPVASPVVVAGDRPVRPQSGAEPCTPARPRKTAHRRADRRSPLRAARSPAATAPSVLEPATAAPAALG